jgi:hypothetical protein
LWGFGGANSLNMRPSIEAQLSGSSTTWIAFQKILILHYLTLIPIGVGLLKSLSFYRKRIQSAGGMKLWIPDFDKVAVLLSVSAFEAKRCDATSVVREF